MTERKRVMRKTEQEIQWRVNIGKLEAKFYREVKQEYKFENDLKLVENSNHKPVLTKLRISAHKLLYQKNLTSQIHFSPPPSDPKLKMTSLLSQKSWHRFSQFRGF